MGGRGGSSHRAVSGGSSGVPLSLQMFAGKEARDIRSLIANAGLSTQDVSYIQQQLSAIIAANDPAMRVRREYVEAIIDSHFKNQMETHTSQGANAPNMRAKLSAEYFGHPYDSVSKAAPDVFEKYGYLAPRDKIAAMSASAEWYGDVVFRFKRESVMDRTTFKTADTLNSWYEGTHAGSLKNASIAGISDLSSYTVQRIKDAERYINQPDRWVDSVSSGEYFELQYHGHLTIGDVESVTFSDELPDNFDRVLRKLKRNGVKVYQVKGGSLNEL